jgi:DNA-binding response OmpR family regulator
VSGSVQKGPQGPRENRWWFCHRVAPSNRGDVEVLRILLVDDDELVRSVISEILCDAGFHVTDTPDPGEVLRLCEATGPPSIVITDIDLGVTLTGFDVAATSRRHWSLVGIILISGLPANHTGQVLDPRDRYLQKPFSDNELLTTINALVHES